MRTLTLLCLLLFGTSTFAQLPNTDLYMFTLLNNGKNIVLKDPVYISGFNPDGYNNQPYFLKPSELYITTNLYDPNFTEFIRLDLQNEVYYRVTATDSISEYSPTPKALSGNFSAVRVEKDGSTQSLWLYPNDHSGPGKRIFKDISNVGYHCWLSEEDVAMFLVSTPMKLAIGNLKSGNIMNIIDDIGRCFQQDSDGNLLFVHKVTPDSWYIKSYNVEDRTAQVITQTRPGSEDFVVLPDGTFLMAEKSKLYSIKPDEDEYWKEAADVSTYGINNVSRLAVSRNRLVLVDTPENK